MLSRTKRKYRNYTTNGVFCALQIRLFALYCLRNSDSDADNAIFFLFSFLACMFKNYLGVLFNHQCMTCTGEVEGVLYLDSLPLLNFLLSEAALKRKPTGDRNVCRRNKSRNTIERKGFTHQMIEKSFSFFPFTLFDFNNF